MSPPWALHFRAFSQTCNHFSPEHLESICGLAGLLMQTEIQIAYVSQVGHFFCAVLSVCK